jgi:hypothetical protein
MGGVMGEVVNGSEGGWWGRGKGGGFMGVCGGKWGTVKVMWEVWGEGELKENGEGGVRWCGGVCRFLWGVVLLINGE